MGSLFGWYFLLLFFFMKSLHCAENSGRNTRNSASAFPAGFPASNRFNPGQRQGGLLGLRVLQFEIGRQRVKSVQQSVDDLARAANGQSERPVEPGIGCNSDVPHARVEDRARGTVARSHWHSGARSACTPEAGSAAAVTGPRVAVGPV